MADNLADFYSGSMAPPVRMPDGSLRPATATPQMSIADMYKGIYPTGASAPRPNVTAEGLNVRGVTTKDIVIGPNGFPVAAASKPAPAPEIANGYGSGYVKTNTDRLPAGTAPALAAIEGAAPARRSNLFAESGYTAKPRFASTAGGGIYGGADPGDTGMFGVPMSDGMRKILAEDQRYATPPGSVATVWNKSAPARAPAAAVPAKPNLLDSIAALFASSPSSPQNALGYNAAYSQTTAGDGQGNNAFSYSDGYNGGARSLTS